jgi:peroxiredoxin
MEMPYIQGVFEDSEWTEQGLVILAVNVGESSSTVGEFFDDNGLSFQILLDTDTKVAQSYNVSGIPATFFIDKSGIIKDIHIGAFTSKENVDWRLINSILEGE